MFDLETTALEASFFDLYSRGAVAAEAIDDFVGRWHHGDDPAAAARELHDYLGLSLTEYQLWVYDADALPVVLAAGRGERPLGGAVRDRLAALGRGDGVVDGTVTRGLRGWLDMRARESAASAG